MIVKHPNSILNQRCLLVEHSEMSNLADELMAVFTDPSVSAVGLAANQIGRNLQAFVYNSGDGPKAMFNPVITNVGKTFLLEKEACLSLPGLFIPTARSTVITVEYTNIYNKRVTDEYGDYEARIIQHEIDHLNGKLIMKKRKKKRK